MVDEPRAMFIQCNRISIYFSTPQQIHLNKNVVREVEGDWIQFSVDKSAEVYTQYP